jgi:hypothetical protein
MEVYLLKMITCSGLLYAYYRVALYNERFHQWNRFFLLAAMLVSMIVPLVNIPVVAPADTGSFVQMVDTIPWQVAYLQQDETWTAIDFAFTSVAFVTLLLLARMAAGLISILRYYRSNPSSELVDNVRLVHTQLSQAPFSFFNWLFWRNDIDPASENGQRMLNHELTHIREHHSADKIFSSLVLCLFWMNPFFWLIRRELNMIHEFLADRKAISTPDGAAFAQMVLQAVPASRLMTDGLVNPFFSSQIKRRLIMITTSKQPRYSYLRRISGLAFMTVLVALLALTVQQAEAQDKQKAEVKTTQKPATKTDAPSQKVTIEPRKAGSTKIKVINTAPQPAENEGVTISLQSAAQNPPIYFLDGKEITAAEMKSIDASEISTVNFYKNEHAIEKYGEKGKNGVVDIVTKKAATTTKAERNVTKISMPEKVIYYIDGELSGKKEVDALDPNDIGTINVLKGETAKRKYGEDAKDGVIEITLKKTN